MPGMSRMIAIVSSLSSVFAFSCGWGPESRYTGDLPEIRSHGVLRVITRLEPIAFLPHNAEPVTLDRDVARGLAEMLGLELRLVIADNYTQMIEKLLAGEGDLVAAGLSITEARQKQVDFSVPYRHVNELLILPDSTMSPRATADLAGREIAVRRSSAYFETLSDLQKDVSSLKIREVPESLSIEEILEGVALGTYPATVIDSNYWTAMAEYYTNLRPSLVMAKDRPVGLAMRHESKLLKEKADEYMKQHALTRHRQVMYTDDLDGLKERGRLRVITRNNAATYFIHRGVQLGFEFELMSKFAAQQGLRLELVIPPSHQDLIPWLREGRGDVIAAAMTMNEQRSRQASFSEPYMLVDEVVVVRTDNDSISSAHDLAGRTVHVRASSSFYQTLKTMQESVGGITVETVPEEMETEEILAALDEGIWDITLCDENLLQVEQAYGRNLKAAFTVKGTELVWGVRKENSQLLAALDVFIKQEYRGLFYNMMKQRYFEDSRTIAKARDPNRADLSGQLSPYDDSIKKYADQYGFDWRLIVAQMYQESRFNPRLKSWAGAQGLMQIMPRTAEQLGVGDIRQPDNGIHGGIKYLDQMMKRFDLTIPQEERIRFALAAYNVGYEHVADARRLAVRMGWSPDLWFDHVEKAMLLLQEPEYYKTARYGFCRGGQPVHYVHAIQDRYEAYIDVLPQANGADISDIMKLSNESQYAVAN